jgi:mRNA-degrading endonuclease RelE of RelBE toxin-antitoxin system
MAWNLHITGPAQKEFLKLPPKDQARVKNALLAMQQDPFSGDIKRLKRTNFSLASPCRQLPNRLRPAP